MRAGTSAFDAGIRRNQLIYLFRFFWWESGYFTSLDIMHDRFGYYICWGGWPGASGCNSLTAQYLVLRPNDLPWPLAAGIFVWSRRGYINYAADAQRQRCGPPKRQHERMGPARPN